MANNGLTKWQLLLSKLDLCLGSLGDFEPPIYPHRVSSFNEDELVDFAFRTKEIWPKGSLSTLTEDQLQKFESEVGFILPQGYREFCQVFGAGRFGWDGFFVNCPDVDDIEGHLGENESLLESCKYNDISEWSSEIKELLNNAYLFGGGGGLVAFIFDLRTYREEDRSCDIYGVDSSNNFICHLGRDFFEFIRDICIGDRAKEEVPELLLGGSSDFDKNSLFYRKTTFFLFRSLSSIREDKDL
ncbi:MAG: SMI1/KNR4 family protein [Microcoleus sp.]